MRRLRAGGRDEAKKRFMPVVAIDRSCPTWIGGAMQWVLKIRNQFAFWPSQSTPMRFHDKGHAASEFW
jgi:hypothetical protein